MGWRMERQRARSVSRRRLHLLLHSRPSRLQHSLSSLSLQLLLLPLCPPLWRLLQHPLLTMLLRLPLLLLPLLLQLLLGKLLPVPAALPRALVVEEAVVLVAVAVVVVEAITATMLARTRNSTIPQHRAQPRLPVLQVLQQPALPLGLPSRLPLHLRRLARQRGHHACSSR